MSGTSHDYEWHIITCEYPPTVGGVSDYSRTLAEALAAAAPTHVWAPGVAADLPGDYGVMVHRTLGTFSPADLDRTGRALDRLPGPRRLLVQWVPHGFGFRSLNLPFAWWLLMRAWRHGDDLQIMVHEPFVMFAARPGQFVMACIHRLMFVTACAGASRVWTSTPSWFARITPYLMGRLTPTWLPVPAPGFGVDASRDADAGAEGPPPVLGHFGTHSPLVTALLAPALDIVLAQTAAHVMLIGRDSDRFLADFVRTRADAAPRLRATGEAEPAELARQIARCDVMLQPYPDGVSARRTSTLALMKNARAVVTNEGHLSEPFWRSEGGLELVDRPDSSALGEAAVRLIADPARRRALAERAASVYDRLFDIRHSVELLTACGSAPRRESAHA